jgi:hypothetical protein
MLNELKIYGWVDASFDTHQNSESHTGYCISLNSKGNGMIYARSVKQNLVSLSSTESESVAAVEAAKEIVWFRTLLREFTVQKTVTPTKLLIDNQSLITLATNYSGHHKKIKHYIRRINYLICLVKQNTLDISYVPTEEQIADILTKPLACDLFEKFRNKLQNSD